MNKNEVLVHDLHACAAFKYPEISNKKAMSMTRNKGMTAWQGRSRLRHPPHYDDRDKGSAWE